MTGKTAPLPQAAKPATPPAPVPPQPAPQPIQQPAPAPAQEVIAPAPPSPTASSFDLQPDPTAVSAPSPAPDVTDTSAPDGEPAQSPFLENAKVQKRPLGAFGFGQDESAPVEETATPEASEAPLTIEPTADEAPAEPAVPAATEETSQASAASFGQSEELVQGSMATFQEEPVGGGESATGVTPASTPAAASPAETPAPAPASAAPSAPTFAQSIPQQYQRAESPETSAPATSVFDTTDYHQPLVTHGTSGRKRILLIAGIVLLLLAVGAAIGYAVYIYQLGS